MKNWKYVEGAKVGNYTPNYRYKGFLITNPEGYEYVVFLQDGLHVGYRGTTSKAQAEDWCDWHDPKTGKPVAKFRNSKTGNIAADITTDGNTWFVTTSDGKKKEFPSEREAEAYVKKIKTGNGVFSIFKSDKPIKMKSPQGAIVTINPDGTAAHQDKEGSQMAVHPHNSFKEAVEYYKSQGYVKVGNAMVGRPYDMGKQLGKEDADYGRYKTREQLKKYFEVEDNNQLNEIERGYKKGQEEYEDRYTFNSKTGNESLGEYMAKKPRVINEEKTGAEEFFKKLSDDVKEREKKDDADIEKVSNAWEWNVNQADVLEYINGSPTATTLQKICVKHLGTNDTSSVEARLVDSNTNKWAVVKRGAKATVKKTGNSASDDKFAYVMREFDEGKLKTPDGKVVTDPAQAKAIAYSESKKTENGLARARNAMVKNWNSDRNINPVGAYKEFIANLKNAIELGVAAVTYNIDGSTLKTWVDQAKKEGYGSHISGIQGQKVILK